MGDLQVTQLTRGMHSLIASVLASSFRNDAAFIHLFGNVSEGNDQYYRRFMELWTDHSIHEQHLMYGVHTEGTLVGVIGISGLQGADQASWSIRYSLPGMLRVLPGLNVAAGLRVLRASRRPKAVPRPCAELSMLAVHPDHQGKGIASILLAKTNEVVSEEPHLAGIYLYTTDDGSRRFYEKNGYSLVASSTVLGVPVHHLFLPRSGLLRQC